MQTRHLALLGDSIFDNAAYAPNGLSVILHMQARLAGTGQASLLARDGDLVRHIEEQIPALTDSTTHIVMSVGGNDALSAIALLEQPAVSVRDALIYLDAIRTDFRQAYRSALLQVMALGRPVAVCTIYDAVPDFPSELQAGLCLFNDSIIREAFSAGAAVIDLRNICTEAGDYSEISPIEPSAQGGEKIAMALLDWMNARASASASPKGMGAV